MCMCVRAGVCVCVCGLGLYYCSLNPSKPVSMLGLIAFSISEFPCRKVWGIGTKTHDSKECVQYVIMLFNWK